MTVTSQIPPDPAVETMEFERLKASGGNRPIELLVKEFGVVYVTSITRDGCSGCAEQKPLFRELAGKMSTKHQGQIRFSNIHIRYKPDDQKESWEAKRVFGHAAYPTYMVHVKSHLGPLEIYRAVYPSMEDLERQTTEALELAEYYKTEASKP
ncbi:MAG: hypothetical protein AABX62_02535 [Thermoproteota archaeon]